MHDVVLTFTLSLKKSKFLSDSEIVFCGCCYHIEIKNIHKFGTAEPKIRRKGEMLSLKMALEHPYIRDCRGKTSYYFLIYIECKDIEEAKQILWTLRLELADHKIEAVLITGRKRF